MASLIGARIARLEDDALLRGRGRFVDDIALAGVLHAAFVRSPHPRALIGSLGKSAALAAPGVHAVLTLDDLAPVMAKRRMLRHSNSGTALDHAWPFALADREVSYVGEAVAIVIAENRYLAEDAAALVEVDYQTLPAAADCRKAVLPDAPPVRRELKSNTVACYRVDYGDADAAFAQAAHVFNEEFWQHRGAGHSIEGRGLLAEFHAADEAITVFASTQKAHDLRQSLTVLLGIDEHRLRVAAPDIGGGFGPKLCVYPEDVAVVAAALALRRSIKWIEDRREHFTNAVQERDQYWSIAIAVDAHGKVLGIRGRLLHDLGAYALQDVNLPYNSASTLTGPYMVPALAMEVTVAATNKTPVSSVRGAGYPQAAFAMERLMDRVARELALDRAELRRRNLIPAEKMPYNKPLKTRAGASVRYDSGDYPACQAQVLAAAGWDDFPRRQAQARAQGRYLGIGLSHGLKGTGRGPFESGLVRISPTGRVTVFTGAAAIGQGLRTALAQICATELGIRAEDVTVVPGDTAGVALGLGAFASRQTVTAGNSVLLAARAVAAKAKKLASHVLEAAEHDLEIADGEVRVIGARQLSVKLAELSRILRGAPGYGFPPGLDPGLEAGREFRVDELAYANGCHVAEVEVDVETGGVQILRYYALQDFGRLINPMIVDGQVMGGIVHGIGNALFERMGYDERGQPLTTTYADYLLPTATELPRIATQYRETPSPLNPLGAKGVGEVGTIPAAAAIISAVEDALTPFGVHIAQVPITPPELLALIVATRTKASLVMTDLHARCRPPLWSGDERHMRYRRFAAVIALAAAFTAPAAAQILDLGKYPDLAGQWVRIGPPRWDTSKPALAQGAPLTGEYQAIFDTGTKDQAEGGQGTNPTATCLAPGMPRSMNVYHPMEIVIAPTTVHILIDHTHDSRRIFTDGRDWPKEEEPYFSGYSIGRWIDTGHEARYDVLEAETRGFKGPRAFDSTGIPLHEDNQTIVKERIYLDNNDRSSLYDEITTIDHALTRPWTVKKKYRRDPSRRPVWTENVCGEGNNHVVIEKRDYVLSADGLLMPAKKNEPPPDLRYFQPINR